MLLRLSFLASPGAEQCLPGGQLGGDFVWRSAHSRRSEVAPIILYIFHDGDGDDAGDGGEDDVAVVGGGARKSHTPWLPALILSPGALIEAER